DFKRTLRSHNSAGGEGMGIRVGRPERYSGTRHFPRGLTAPETDYLPLHRDRLDGLQFEIGGGKLLTLAENDGRGARAMVNSRIKRFKIDLSRPGIFPRLRIAPWRQRILQSTGVGRIEHGLSNSLVGGILGPHKILSGKQVGNPEFPQLVGFGGWIHARWRSGPKYQASLKLEPPRGVARLQRRDFHPGEGLAIFVVDVPGDGRGPVELN